MADEQKPVDQIPAEPAFDFGELIDKLKDKGLNVAEDAAAVLVECTLDWVAEGALKSENVIVKSLGAFAPMAKQVILPLVDKIDGEDDPNR